MENVGPATVGIGPERARLTYIGHRKVPEALI